MSGGAHDIVTSIGDSSDIVYRRLEEPICMHTMVPVSSHAAMRGSQWPSRLWIVGRPNMAGFSENETARDPFAAVRRTSAAASTGSQRGMRVNGM
jgi:hypothetical protein